MEDEIFIKHMSEKLSVHCIDCGSEELVKNGTRDCARRYKCKNCNKQFSLNIDDSLNFHKMLNMIDACTKFTDETTPQEMRQKTVSIKHLIEIIPKIKEIKDVVKRSLKEEKHEEENHPIDRISTLSPAEFSELEDKLVREKERRIKKGEAVWGYTRFKKREDGTYYDASKDVILVNSDGVSVTHEAYEQREPEEENYEEYFEEEYEEEYKEGAKKQEYIINTQALFDGFCEFKDDNPYATAEEYIAFIKKKEREQASASATLQDECLQSSNDIDASLQSSNDEDASLQSSNDEDASLQSSNDEDGSLQSSNDEDGSLQSSNDEDGSSGSSMVA